MYGSGSIYAAKCDTEAAMCNPRVGTPAGESLSKASQTQNRFMELAKEGAELDQMLAELVRRTQAVRLGRPQCGQQNKGVDEPEEVRSPIEDFIIQEIRRVRRQQEVVVSLIGELRI